MNPANRDVELLWRTMTALVRGDNRDLTARQLATFLLIYLDEGPHTIRGIAEKLRIAKPAMTRAADRLEELQYTRRLRDPMDRRSVLLQRTAKGSTFLRSLQEIMREVAQDSPDNPPEKGAGRRRPT